MPSTTAAVALTKAIFSDSTKPLMISASIISWPYQRVEKPLHTMSWRELLKEKTTSTAIGK